MSLTDKIAEQHAQLASIKATEVELTVGPDAALSVLGPPTDPIRLRAALGILVRSKNFSQAADMIQHLSPHEKWIDLGTAIFANIGNVVRARNFVEQADEYPDRLIRLRTRLGFAEGIIERLRTLHGNASLLALRAWSVAEIEESKQALEVLGPLLLIVRANNRIQGELELVAVECAVQFAHITNDQSFLSQTATWLKRHAPIPLLVAELSLRRMTECPENLPGRLRSEHPGDFKAAFLASLIERDILDHAEDSFDALIRLGTQTSSDEEKKSVSLALFETCGYCGPDRVDEAIQTIKTLMPEESLIPALLEVSKKVVAEDLIGARSQLDSIRDESSSAWWQTHAQLLEKSGCSGDAEDAWQKASELLPHPEVVRRSIQASLEQRHFERAILNTKVLLEEDPNSVPDLHAIVHALVLTGDYLHAAEYLHRLVAIEPNRTDYKLSLAQCLGRSTQTKMAINVLESLCSAENPPFEAILLQSEFLIADGRFNKALILLNRVAADHWDEPEFLLRYMDCAHRAEEEKLANKAFVRLLQLRQVGKVPLELMQAKTLEELLEYGKQYSKGRDTLQQAVVGGRIPWLYAEEQMRNTAVWAWALHTQDLRWNSEEPLSRASYSIYASNGFTVCTTNESRQLLAIHAPAQGSEVVVDLSALLTLHALHKLESVADFFGGLILPASYGNLHAKDANRFSQHQPSRETELRRIREQVEGKYIHLVDTIQSELLCVDEYSNDSQSQVYRLKDLIPPLQNAQNVPKEMIDSLRLVAHKDESAEGSAKVDIGARLLIDLPTLRTLADQPIFDAIVKTFSVHLKSSQWDEVLSELNAYRFSRLAKTNHDALWADVSRLLAERKIQYEPVPATTNAKLDSEGDEDMHVLQLDSAELARSLGKPLLVDDRVLQVMMFQEDPNSVSRAFDTSRTLQAMVEAGVSTLSDAAKDVRNLMKWRYRFIVPSAQIMFEWALDFIDILPGDALLDAASYLHDSLRDPGLYCGLEQSEPPLPMAARLVTSWSEAIASFLAQVWSDTRFTDDKAARLTQWIGEDLIPSCPRGMTFHSLGLTISQAEKGSLLGMIMVQFTAVPDRYRANLGLRILANTFGMDEDAFLLATAEAIRVIAKQ